MCVDLRDNFEMVRDNEVRCWILDFDNYVKETSLGLHQVPIEDPELFEAYLLAFAFTTKQG